MGVSSRVLDNPGQICIFWKLLYIYGISKKIDLIRFKLFQDFLRFLRGWIVEVEASLFGNGSGFWKFNLT